MTMHTACGDRCVAQRYAKYSDSILPQAIIWHIQLVVPDDIPTLASAVRLAIPGQRILIRTGEHTVSSQSRLLVHVATHKNSPSHASCP